MTFLPSFSTRRTLYSGMFHMLMTDVAVSLEEVPPVLGPRVCKPAAAGSSPLADINFFSLSAARRRRDELRGQKLH